MTSTVLAIDPGTEQSGFCALRSDGKIVASGVLPNGEMLSMLLAGAPQITTEGDMLAIEMIASYGMPVGREVFVTCLWIGRYQQAWPGESVLIYRRDVKLHLCGTARAKDGHVRQRLIDLLGRPGKKSQPGPTFGVKSHAWAALAVGATYWGLS